MGAAPSRWPSSDSKTVSAAPSQPSSDSKSAAADLTFCDGRAVPTRSLLPPQLLPHHAELERCTLWVHLHVPKSGGTAVKDVLRGFHSFVNSPLSGYRYHGKGAPRMPRRSAARTVFTSTEAGLCDDLQTRWSEYKHACFFAVVREPREWAVSALGHLHGEYAAERLQQTLAAAGEPLKSTAECGLKPAPRSTSDGPACVPGENFGCVAGMPSELWTNGTCFGIFNCGSTGLLSKCGYASHKYKGKVSRERGPESLAMLCQSED